MEATHRVVVRRDATPTDTLTDTPTDVADDDVLVHIESPDDVALAVRAAASGGSVVAVVVGDRALVELTVAELRRRGRVVLDDEATSPAPPASGGRVAAMPPEAAALLDLLAAGETVSSAAVRLHLSRRTAARRLAEARAALGVDTTREAVLAYRSGPASTRTLVGRDRLLADIAELLRVDRGVLLVGEGAVGKTTLLRAAMAATGRPALVGGGQETLRWQDYWTVGRAVGDELLAGDVEAVSAAVESRVGPDLLVVDDVHLADDASVAVLAALGDRVAVLAAARPDPAGSPGGPVERLTAAGFAVVDVAPLPDAAVADLARSLAPGLRPTDLRDVVARSAGLLLLVEFLCGATGDETLGRGLVPAVEDLPPDSRRSALRLALAGVPLPADDQADVLVTAGIAIAVDGSVRIRHALVADAAVATSSPDDIAEAHRELARGASDAAVAARHWIAAGDRAEAVRSSLAAIARAVTPADRARLTVLAAEACDDDRRPSLLLEAVAAASAAGLHLDVLRIVDLLGAEPSLTAVDRARCDLFAARAFWHEGDTSSARRHAREGLDLVAGSGTDAEAALAVELVRGELLSIGPRDDHAALLARAGDITGGRGAGGAALLSIEGIYRHFVDGGGRDLWERGRSLARESGDLDTEMRCGNNLITWEESCGDAQTGLRIAAEMAARATELGLGEWRSQFNAMAANLMYHRAEYANVFAILDEVEATALDGRTRLQAVQTRVAALIDLGLLDVAAGLLPTSGGREYDWLRDGTDVYLTAALHLWSGRPKEAISVVEVALPTLQGNPTSESWFVAPVLMWAFHEAGVRPSAPFVLSNPDQIEMSRALAMEASGVRLLSEDPAAAAELLDRAAALLEPFSRPPSLRAAWGAGEARRLAGAPDAVERLLDVETAVAAVGMEPLLSRVRRSLRLAGVPRSARRAPDRTGLVSAREREVLDLVGGGRTYAEIARRLGVGRPTVRRLVQNATQKLGAPSPVAAAALLASA